MSSLAPLIIILALFIGMVYFLMIRPIRQRERKHDELVDELEKGDIVITAGGVYGQVERIDEDSIILKVESGATIRVTKGGILSRPEKQRLV
ncbi:MAG: preprotein translocase subunit YajC [Chloroflexi bacterium]|nr:preprotein translocase subunit YajC [Chloroflexota bacterium]MBI3930829.1 preprotein translocase subunit YajC [Chloroflexota bacterium]